MDKQDNLTKSLKATFDELKLQAHLFKSDAKDEWQDLEKKWDHTINKISRNLSSTKSEIKEDAVETIDELQKKLIYLKNMLKKKD